MKNGSIQRRVGFKITIIREQRGWSQEKLAAKAGLHRAYIGQIPSVFYLA
jgi:ribosome-binding protein aMBF1 (putative translation factor)